MWRVKTRSAGAAVRSAAGAAVGLAERETSHREACVLMRGFFCNVSRALFPCNVGREGGFSLVTLEGNEGFPL